MPNAELGRIPGLQAPIARRRERESKVFDTTQPLIQAIIRGGKTGSKKASPVDCLVISPELDVMGRQPINELYGESKRRGLRYAEGYFMFLVESLEGKQPGLGNVILNNERPLQHVLDIFRTPTTGYHDYTVVVIDARAFEDGGTLTIDIEVGRAEGAGSFFLFDGNSKLSTEKVPKDTLARVWLISPGDTGQITHHFDEGKMFKLGASGQRSNKRGTVNAFQARISVETPKKNES